MIIDRVKDAYTDAVQVGNMWRGVFRLPHKKQQYVEVDGVVERYSTEAKALRAASDAVFAHMPNNCLGSRAVELTAVRKKADALFSKPRQEA